MEIKIKIICGECEKRFKPIGSFNFPDNAYYRCPKCKKTIEVETMVTNSQHPNGY